MLEKLETIIRFLEDALKVFDQLGCMQQMREYSIAIENLKSNFRSTINKVKSLKQRLEENNG